MVVPPFERARKTLADFSKPIGGTAKPQAPATQMTDEPWAQWLKLIVEEQRKQTKALNDLGCMVFAIAIVVVGVAALTFLGGLLSSGLVR